MAAMLDDKVAAATKTVLLLDTATGRVWKYQEAFTTTDTEGKKSWIPAAFILVTVADGLPMMK